MSRYLSSSIAGVKESARGGLVVVVPGCTAPALAVAGGCAGVVAVAGGGTGDWRCSCREVDVDVKHDLSTIEPK
ncbi:hypothetical protein OUZ56_024237 [Daphnia magna]|uniref:Uncharacterized protein n=1 Tax=Daphnia magna TaxID=35525 RepID=A0ABR0B0E9_9CRUS|nr:hypothetical protein OUZ56_024237 [Daphnia magna]